MKIRRLDTQLAQNAGRTGLFVRRAVSSTCARHAMPRHKIKLCVYSCICTPYCLTRAILRTYTYLRTSTGTHIHIQSSESL